MTTERRLSDEQLSQLEALRLKQLETAGTVEGPAAFKNYEWGLWRSAEQLIAELLERRAADKK